MTRAVFQLSAASWLFLGLLCCGGGESGSTGGDSGTELGSPELILDASAELPESASETTPEALADVADLADEDSEVLELDAALELPPQEVETLEPDVGPEAPVVPETEEPAPEVQETVEDAGPPEEVGPPPWIDVPRTSLAEGFHVPLAPPEEGASFSIIMASDPQLWWNSIDGVSGDDVITDAMVEVQNQLHVDAMNVLISGEQLPEGAPAPLAVVMNGDITEYGRWIQWDAYYRLFEGVNAPIFDGLGNHDYENNNQIVANGCAMQVEHWQLWRDACEAGSTQTLWGQSACEVKESITELWTWCARDTMRRMRYWLTTHAEHLYDWDEGSAAYSFELGDFHFIQLHNSHKYEVPETGICSPLNWLKKDLKDAFLRDKKIVLLMHQPISSSLRPHLRGYQYNIVGIFYGHHHGYAGHTDDYAVDGIEIPEFYSGSVQWNLFSLASFAPDRLTVTAIDSNTGQPVHHATAEAYDNLSGATVWAPFTYVFPAHDCPSGQIPTGSGVACETPSLETPPVELCY